MNKLSTKIAVLAALVLAFLAGATDETMLTGDLIPSRTSADGCQAFDASSGRVVGEFPKVDGRCHIKQWRLYHPFQG